MELNFLYRTLFLFFLLSSCSSSSFISDGVFESQSLVTGRSLLQTKNECPVDFQFKNYTILTDNCKGPNFPPKECCAAFKEFACPYVDYINDLSTKCAVVMFTYINQYGKYPRGLFANLCKEGKKGLACPASPPASAADLNAAITGSAAEADINAAITASSSSSCLWLKVSVVFLVFINLF